MTRAPEVVTTARLRGERLGPRLLDDVAPIRADPRVGETMGGTRSRVEVAEWLERVDMAWELDGFGLYAWRDADGGVVAVGGPERAVFDGSPVVELAWTVVPERWGQGLATEVGQAAVDLAFGTLGLPEVVACTLPHNAASRRVMEKLGLAYVRTAPHPPWGDHALYVRRR